MATTCDKNLSVQIFSQLKGCAQKLNFPDIYYNKLYEETYYIIYCTSDTKC